MDLQDSRDAISSPPPAYFEVNNSLPERERERDIWQLSNLSLVPTQQFALIFRHYTPDPVIQGYFVWAGVGGAGERGEIVLNIPKRNLARLHTI